MRTRTSSSYPWKIQLNTEADLLQSSTSDSAAVQTHFIHLGGVGNCGHRKGQEQNVLLNKSVLKVRHPFRTKRKSLPTPNAYANRQPGREAPDVFGAAVSNRTDLSWAECDIWHDLHAECHTHFSHVKTEVGVKTGQGNTKSAEPPSAGNIKNSDSRWVLLSLSLSLI